MNGTVNVNNYILTILSFAFSSLFTFISCFIIISFLTLDFFRVRACVPCVQVATPLNSVKPLFSV